MVQCRAINCREACYGEAPLCEKHWNEADPDLCSAELRRRRNWSPTNGAPTPLYLLALRRLLNSIAVKEGVYTEDTAKQHEEITRRAYNIPPGVNP